MQIRDPLHLLRNKCVLHALLLTAGREENFAQRSLIFGSCVGSESNRLHCLVLPLNHVRDMELDADAEPGDHPRP
jgi:hypothetical protein